MALKFSRNPDDRTPMTFEFVDKDGALKWMSLDVWESAAGGCYLLAKIGKDPFVRSQADFYVRLGNIADCPAT